jgi:spore maturation protein CgeB
MTAPYTGLRVIFAAHVDDASLAYNGLRLRALERLGCTVQLLDPDKAGWIERLVRRDVDQRLRAALDQQSPDLVIVAGQDVIPNEVASDLRSGRSAKWIQILEDEISKPDLVAADAMAYDHVFIGSTGGLNTLKKNGILHGHYLALGCDPSVHKPLRARGVFRANVVFAGVANSRRERLLTELVEFGLALWGAGWRRTGLKDYCRGELPTHEDFVRAYAGATVAVNIHRHGPDERNGDPTGVNRRTFELAAIGVTQVVDTRPDLAQHFEDGSEVLLYTSAEELKGQVKRAVQEDKYRERLASNARQRALRNHTYMHRMAEMLKAVTGTG